FGRTKPSALSFVFVRLRARTRSRDTIFRDTISRSTITNNIHNRPAPPTNLPNRLRSSLAFGRAKLFRAPVRFAHGNFGSLWCSSLARSPACGRIHRAPTAPPVPFLRALFGSRNQTLILTDGRERTMVSALWWVLGGVLLYSVVAM